MTKLLLLLMFACSPSDVEVGEFPPAEDSQAPEPPMAPVGVVTADDCQQLNLGDTACNFALLDQNGDTWELYNHHDNVIVLDFSTVWCPPCQAAGYHTQPIQDEYADDNVKFVTVLIDGAISGVEPSEAEINEWVDSHVITSAPILQGSREKMLATDPDAYDGYLLSGFPTYVYIGRDMKFYSAHVGFSESHVRLTIEEGL
jgi:thiol-disulfide isomerase/thioredoxin